MRRTDSRRIDGRTIQLPMVDVHTVGAGGGSIGWRDAGGALRVGPRSAGAEPGPACYGRGGTEPTVTDANLLLGHLAADSRLAGGVALDAEAAERGDRRPRPLARPRPAGDRRRDRPRRQPGDGAGAAGGHGRARRSTRAASRCCPSAAPARCTPRRSPPSSGSRRSSARAPSGVLSALGLCASERRRDTARTVMLSGAELSAERIAAEVGELIAAAGAGLGEAQARGRLRDALRRPGLRAAGPRPGRSRPGRPARALRARPRGALRPPRPRRRGRPRRHPPGAGRARARAAAGRRGRRAPRGERAARSASTASGSRPRSCAASPPPAPAPRARSSSSCPRRPWCCRPAGRAEVDDAGTIVARFETHEMRAKGTAR